MLNLLLKYITILVAECFGYKLMFFLLLPSISILFLVVTALMAKSRQLSFNFQPPTAFKMLLLKDGLWNIIVDGCSSTVIMASKRFNFILEAVVGLERI